MNKLLLFLYWLTTAAEVKTVFYRFSMLLVLKLGLILFLLPSEITDLYLMRQMFIIAVIAIYVAFLLQLYEIFKTNDQ